MKFYAPPNVSLPNLIIILEGNDKLDFHLSDKNFSSTSKLDWSSSSVNISDTGEGFNGSITLSHHKINNLIIKVESLALELYDMDIATASVTTINGSIYIGVPTSVGLVKAIVKETNG
jgi:hypothetical protein